jgi:hypothetical protein
MVPEAEDAAVKMSVVDFELVSSGITAVPTEESDAVLV